MPTAIPRSRRNWLCRSGEPQQPRQAIARYNANGTLDTSFGGGDGTASVDLGGLDYAYTLTVQSDGRVVAAGLSLRSTNQYTIGLARFNADGSLDTSFDTDGWRIDDFGVTGNTLAYDVAVANDGRVVIAGKTGADFAVAAYDGGRERLYAQQDANYNVTSVTDAYGAVKERYLYDPYGAVTYNTAAWGSQASSNHSWVYMHQGLRYDVTATLYDGRNRVYDAELGRFTSADPIGYADGMNRYQAYASSPATLVDPSGLFVPDAVKVAGAVAVADGPQPGPADIIAGGVLLCGLGYQGGKLLAPAIVAPAPGYYPPLGPGYIPQPGWDGQPGAVASGDGPTSQPSAGANNPTSQPSPATQPSSQNLTNNVGKMADKFGCSPKNIKDAIHAVKKGMKAGGPKKNPDVQVDLDTGEVYPEVGDGTVGDSIGNIHDHLPDE